MVRGGHTHYPCKRLYMGIPQLETKVKPERSFKDILILTPSQNLKHIEQLIKGLPDYTFHIAADTMVSEYVQNLGKIGDVEVLPCISNDKLNELLNKCAFYLDINDLYTIHEAVPTVIAHGAIALSFDTDIHYRELMCPDLILTKPEDMIASIRSLSTSKEVFEEKRKEQIQLFENWKPNKEVFQ